MIEVPPEEELFDGKMMHLGSLRGDEASITRNSIRSQ